MRAAALLGLLALVGCGDGHTYVEVAVTSTDRIALEWLEVTVTNGQKQGFVVFQLGVGGVFLPPQQSFALKLDGRSGDVLVDVIGNFAGPQARATGRDHIDPGDTAHLQLTLKPICSDGQKDGMESDVDCGGQCNTGCAVGRGCNQDHDCDSTACNQETHVCAPAHCRNQARDADETDEDCGGLDCATCPPDRACKVATDCGTGRCDGGRCTLATAPPYWIPAPGPSLASPSLAGALGADGKVWLATSTTVSTYAPATNTLQQVGVLSQPRSDVAATFYGDGHFLVIGGQNNATPTGVVESFDLLGSTPFPGLSTPLGGLAAAAADLNNVYVVGGPEAMTFSDIYNEWRPAGALFPRAFLAATAVGGEVYAIGGETSTATLSLVEQLPSFGSTWQTVAQLQTARAHHGAAAGSDGRIYAIGGTDGSKTLASVEVYTPSVDRWSPVAPLKEPRRNLVAVRLLDGRIAVIGGGDLPTYASTIEIYGPSMQVSPPLPRVGDMVSLAGSNFAANAKVTVTDRAGSVVGYGDTDASGRLVAPISWRVTSTAGLETWVTVEDDRSRYPVQVTFTVAK